VKVLRITVSLVEDSESWPSFWERCEETVSADFEALGAKLNLPWGSGGGTLPNGGIRRYATFERPDQRTGRWPLGQSFEEMLTEAIAEYVPPAAMITVTIDHQGSELHYDAVLESDRTVVRQGPSGAAACPKRPAQLKRAVNKILAEISSFISESEAPIRDLASRPTDTN